MSVHVLYVALLDMCVSLTVIERQHPWARWWEEATERSSIKGLH